MDNNLLKNVKVTRVKNAVAAGTAEVDSSIIDMTGFDGVMFAILLGAVVDAANLNAKAQSNALNQTGGMADISGAATGVTALTSAANGNTVVLLDVYRPPNEFVRAVLLPTTQNVAFDGVLAIQYKAHKKPTIHDATTVMAGILTAF